MSDREYPLVDWLARRAGGHPRVRLGIGDDMAEIAWSSGGVLASTDMLLDGVHFDATVHSYGQIGRKALACCLSDSAAMAARPVAAMVSVALAPQTTETDLRALLDGVLALAAEFDVALIGGDTTRWSHPLAIDVAVLAEQKGRSVRRRGARDGDGLWVTGTLGGSLSGRHLTFTPRVREAQALAAELAADLHAMIDITDGLSLDLHRMCRASEVGATLVAEQLVGVAGEDAVAAAHADGRTVLDHVLTDGEDFELLLAVGPDPPVPPRGIRQIGRIQAGPGIELVHADGRRQAVEPRGYSHL